MASTCYYNIPTYDAEAKRRIAILPGQFCLTRPVEAIEAAQFIAEQFWRAEQILRSDFPLVFVLYERRDGPELCRVEVRKEMQAVFAGVLK